jgi:predicted TIM-barrel fold metal-dependent hydrolase
MQKELGGKSAIGFLADMNRKLVDLGAGRLADMDESGIDMQVLSLSGLGLYKLDPAAGTSLAHDCNDTLAAAVNQYPGRFAGLAALGMQDPEKAAMELERCVTTLGFKGAIINGTIQGDFLDHPRFQPVLSQAEKLEVPIYLHPAPPPAEVYHGYFSGLPEGIAAALSTAGWGWHVETGLHCLRLVAAGIFDRFPNLQVIIGHMGENLPFSLVRAEGRLNTAGVRLEKPVGEYFHANFHITTSGYFTIPPLLCALMVFGADRILFAVDYPFSPNTAGRTFLQVAPVSPQDLAKISHANAERLFKLF